MKKQVIKDKETILDLTIKQIQKDFGEGSVMKLGDNTTMNIEVISTGSYNIDKALGVYGLPKGRIVEIYGTESSGKTTLALHVAAECQKMGGVVTFIDAEHALDPAYAKALGVDVEELLISQPDTGEQALEIADMLAKSGVVDLIVIDSVAALVPKAELDGEMIDHQMGLQARLMSKALRKLTATLNRSKTTMIFINQIREKINTFGYGPQTTTSGGRALKFYSSIRLELKRVGGVKQSENVIGNKVKVKVTKNKVAPPFKETNIEIIYGKGISKTSEIIDAALDNNIITKSGSWYKFYDERLGQGKENVRELIEKNETLKLKILEHLDLEKDTNLQELKDVAELSDFIDDEEFVNL